MTNFSLHLMEHYGFESNFCNPSAGNEKGSVENAVGFSRRNHLNGCRSFKSFEEANIYLEDACDDEISKGTHYRTGKRLAIIKEELGNALMPLLPARKWRRWEQRRVNSYQLIDIDNHLYSVPEKFLLNSLRIGIRAFSIEIFTGEEFIVEHQRKFVPGADSLVLDHYLDQLCKKPGALWDCKAIQELSGDETLLKLWEKLIAKYPKLSLQEPSKIRASQKSFIEVLLLRRKYQEEIWKSAIKSALESELTDAASIECIIRGISNPKVPFEAQHM